MPIITHIFNQQQRVQGGRIVADDKVMRIATLEYDYSGQELILSIQPSLSPKKAFLYKEEGFSLFYRGADPDYKFIVECWPDNGTIRSLSVFRLDTGVEYRYLSDHQDRL